MKSEEVMQSRKQCSEEFLRVKRLEEKDGGAATCGTCKNRVKVNQYGVRCDGCDRWFHGVCENVSTEEYKYLTLVEEIMWF